MNTPQNTSHVVFCYDKNLFECKHCGDTYKPALPAPLDIFIATCNAFVKIHKNCKSNQYLIHDEENQNQDDPVAGKTLLSTIKNLPDFFPSINLTPAVIHNQISKSQDRFDSSGQHKIPGNGLAATGAIIRHGRKILIDVEKYGAWLKGTPFNMDNQDEQDTNQS